MKRTLSAPYRALVLIAILAIGILLLLATASAATGSSEPPPTPTAYVVQPGDTLWSIAEAAYDDDVDTRQAIHSIRALNELDTSSLSIGQPLLLPAA
ncbi:MAG: LysM peptidoglycan-binding domain-containing protein [Acidimicrobiia bacterium]|nr:LysM peptidoglycan-binding domain-containing protein [Acidimicrobiia bacterium]